MNMYTKILVAFDGSPSSRNALNQAFRLGNWIKVVAVVPEYEGDLDLFGVQNIREVIEGPGEKLLAEARTLADQAGVAIQAEMKRGEPYKRLVEVAAEENCDCIIMGRKGRSQIERDLMGGVTARVIGHTNRDVLVVQEESEVGWKKILFATDGSDCSAAAETLAIELAARFSAELTAIRVVPVNDEFLALAPKAVEELNAQAGTDLERFAARAEKQGVSAKTIIKEGEPHEIITTLAGELQTSVIVMGSHGRKGFSRLFMGSVTERVIGFAPCPVLVRHL